MASITSAEIIAPEILAHAFDRFYRGVENPESQGFGLGLPIALSLVQGQGEASGWKASRARAAS